MSMLETSWDTSLCLTICSVCQTIEHARTCWIQSCLGDGNPAKITAVSITSIKKVCTYSNCWQFIVFLVRLQPSAQTRFPSIPNPPKLTALGKPWPLVQQPPQPHRWQWRWTTWMWTWVPELARVSLRLIGPWWVFLKPSFLLLQIIGFLGTTGWGGPFIGMWIRLM